MLCWHCIITFELCITRIHSQTTIPGLDQTAYVKLGDINVGYLSYVHRYSSTRFCSDTTSAAGAQYSTVPEFITDLINADHTILPNITMGFVAFDDCQKDLTALARTLSFAPNMRYNTKRRKYDVVGVVGPNYSSQSAIISKFLGLFQIPVLSTYATSDELSDKTQFPYFMRLVPPDAFQALALVDILEHFGWSYVSLLHSGGNYGDNGARQIEVLTKARGICLAVNQRLSSDFTDEDIENIIGKIRSNKNAHVVVLFLEGYDVKKLLTLVKKLDLKNEFVWIASDTFISINGLDIADVAAGSIFIGHSHPRVPAFEEYIQGLSWRNSSNPWLPLVFQNAYGCSWTSENPSPNGTSQNSVHNHPCESHETLREVTESHSWAGPVRRIDGFLVYAKALHELISDRCPWMFRKDFSRNFSDCVDGSLLLQYMRNVSFDGYSGPLSFDEKGDRQGAYGIHQVYVDSNNVPKFNYIVGEWDSLTRSLFLNKTQLDWGRMTNTSIESFCSHPCEIGHYYQTKEVACCWECIECRENEIVVRNRTACNQCPDFTWPHDRTRTSCDAIQPYALQRTEAVGACLISLAAVGMLLSIVVIVVYAVKRNNRLLKATSRELSVMIVVGCMLACVVSILFITYPDRLGCLLRQTGFHLVVSIIYCPQLAKTSRVYRIFSAGKQGGGRPKYISNKAQMLFTFIMIALQVSILIRRVKIYIMTSVNCKIITDVISFLKYIIIYIYLLSEYYHYILLFVNSLDSCA